MNEHDVLIAGAGPAGAHAALRLARAGWRVGLLDARTFPREKPCGEFLSPACLPFLEELGLLAGLRAAEAAPVTEMRLGTRAGDLRGGYHPVGPYRASHGHGLGVRREVLDTQAVEAAAREPGVDLRLGWRVSGAFERDGRVAGLVVRDPGGEAQTLRARFVLGADGQRGRVARSLGWQRELRGERRFALVARYADVAPAPNAEVHFVGRDYFAACPIDGGRFTANLVLDERELRGGRGRLEELFDERLREAPPLARRLAGKRPYEPLAVCGPLGNEVRRCTAPGVALVGDACGFVDPLTGEGLYFAMHGAALVARAVDSALREPARERAALRRYELRRRVAFGPRYTLARMLQRGLRREGLPERVLATLGRRPGFLDLLLGMTGDYVPPRALLDPRAWRVALRRPSRAGAC